jgi:ssDNA-binding Zn-finger/Zn-ribbon topoisomerase 1
MYFAPLSVHGFLFCCPHFNTAAIRVQPESEGGDFFRNLLYTKSKHTKQAEPENSACPERIYHMIIQSI